jgi:hypothetical protein
MTGPQGSGNHLFSKAFGLNKEFWCWPELQENYWMGHDTEPFAECWKDPLMLSYIPWHKSEYFFASISCPYFDNGVEKIPDYEDFLTHASLYAKVKVLVIGRDQTILAHQQQRVRGKVTTNQFLKHIEMLSDYMPAFASQELLYLYGLEYLQSVERSLYIPAHKCSYDSEGLAAILETDANQKYIQPIEHNWLDEEIKIASSKHD